MKKNNTHIDDFFRKKLGDYSEVPPAGSWQDMDTKLDTLVPQAVPSSPLRWLGHVGMVSLIGVLGISLLLKYTDKSGAPAASVAQSQQAPASGQSTANTGSIGTETPSGQEAVSGNNTATMAARATSNPANAASDPVAAASVQPVGSPVPASKSNPSANTGAAEGASEQILPASNHASGAGGRRNKQNNVRKSIPAHRAQQAQVQNDARIASEATVPDSKVYNSSTGKQVGNFGTADSEPAQPLQPALVPGSVIARKGSTLLANANIKNSAAENKPAVVKKSKPDFDRWDAGVKGGYERGFTNVAGTKYVAAAYLQYNLSPKTALMIQPAAKFANAPERIIEDPKSYYRTNNDGSVNVQNSYTTIKVEGSSIVTYYNTKFRYSQSHDSIVKTNKTGGAYMEFELPVLFRYNVTPKASVYAGVNVVYSKLQGVTEHTYTKSGILRSVDTLITATTAPVAPPLNEIISYNGNNFSDYNGPLYPSDRESRLRMGAMLGFSYEYSERWMLDALVQKNPAPSDMRNGFNVNAPLSATCFRLSVGYKIKK